MAKFHKIIKYLPVFFFEKILIAKRVKDILWIEIGVVIIKAIIMAGGKGTRLRPLTCGIPKPMVPLFDKPVMEYTLNLLKEHGFYDVGITLSYLPQVIIDYFGEGKDYDLRIKYFIEKTALGTGGSVRNADNYLDSTFIVISGDAITDLDLEKAIDFHRRKNSKATIVLKRVPIPIEYGVVITMPDGRIVRFLEKPGWSEVFSDTVNTGIYILEPEVLNYYSKGQVFDFSKDLFPRLLKDEIPMYGYIMDDYWCDIGDLVSYRQTHFDILDGKVKIKLEGNEIEKGIWMCNGVFVSGSAKLISPLYIGNGSIIEDDAYVDSYSVISNNCRIGPRSKIKRSIMWKSTEIGEDTKISGTVLCSNSVIKNGVNIFENTVIGENTVILDNSVIKPEVKIWPEKKVYENTTVSQNIVWGTKASKNIFGMKGVSGIINMEITPEFCSRLGSAYGLTIGSGNVLIVSSDNGSQSEIVKNSLISGILSVGGQCIKLKSSTLPMTKFGIVYHKASGGIHIYTEKNKPYKTFIEFFDGEGINIDRNTERSIENLLNSGDFERCKIEDIKFQTEIENFKEIYIKHGISLIPNIDAIRRKNFNLLLASNSEGIISIANAYLKSLGCNISSIWGNTDINSFSRDLLNIKADLGIIISESGENLTLMDEKGTLIENEKYLLLSELIAIKGYDVKKYVLPHAFPSVADKIANNNRADTVRTSSNISSIIRKIYELNSGMDIYPIQYILNFDAIWALGLIMNYLVVQKLSLNDMLSEIPVFHFTKNEIPCDWEDKGRVIRKMAIDRIKKERDMNEGVKIIDRRGWAIVLPDNEKPKFNIYTEGFSEEMAKELSSELIDKISDLLKKQGFKKE